MITAIVCVDENWGIGKDNELLAHIPEDIEMFKKVTTGGRIIMGRKTYDSLPKKPLPYRKNIVITSKVNKPKIQEDGTIFTDMQSVKELLNSESVFTDDSDTYIIGGETIYKELLPYCEKVLVTKVWYMYDNVDTYFPNIDELKEWTLWDESKIKEYNGLRYHFCSYINLDNVNKDKWKAE